jgi:hypothetical protein
MLNAAGELTRKADDRKRRWLAADTLKAGRIGDRERSWFAANGLKAGRIGESEKKLVRG